MNGKHFIGSKALSANTYKAYEPITQVVLWVDNNNCYIAGTDTGTVLEADCPYANQEMADALLASMSGYVYEPVEADGARLTPVAELGDGITINGIYTQLAYQNIRFSTGEVMDIAAPGGGEALHEYQVEGELSKDFEHQLAETHSEIIKTAEEIRLEVENEIEGLSSSISVQLDSITSTVEGQNGQISQMQQTVDSISSTVSGYDGQISSIEQKVNNIRLSVSNGSTSSSISLSVDGVVVSSQNIQMNGLVTFTGLANGTTTINGSCIKTGLIDADRLNLTGSITFGDLSSTVQNDINDAYSMAQNAQWDAQDAVSTVSGWTYPGTTYIDGSKIETGTVRASILEGGEIILLSSELDRWGDPEEAGRIYLDGASSYNGEKVTIESGAIEIATTSQSGNIYLGLSRGTYIQLEDLYITVGDGDLKPNMDNYWYCGTPDSRWMAVCTVNLDSNNSRSIDAYSTNGSSVTSDQKKKVDISYNMSVYGQLFDLLKPASFKRIDGTSGRTHLGLIAQEVEAALPEAGLTSVEFAGLVKDPVLDESGQETGEYDYYLRYGEFVSLCIWKIQQLEARVKAVEGVA